MRKVFKNIQNLFHIKDKHHCYRLISINQNQTGNYIAVVQVVNKNLTFKIKPEEILSDDNMTDSFSQRDIRTLTYLGYLGINAPKYTVLAKRLSETDNNFLFAIKERDNKKPIVRTASQISENESFITGFNQKDAHAIGYTAAMESVMSEENQKSQLLHENKFGKNTK